MPGTSILWLLLHPQDLLSNNFASYLDQTGYLYEPLAHQTLHIVLRCL